MKSRGTTIWKELKHRLLNTWGSYLGLIVFLTVFRILPLRIGRFIARVSGIIWFWLDGMHRRIGLENLALAFPEKSEAERRAILRAMKDQKFVGVIMDLYAGSKNPQVRMFGHETSTVDTVARLHLKTGAPIVTNLMMRRPDGRYLWRCRRVEIPALRPGEDSDAHVRAILESCNQAFEQTIREFPEQWLWMHRRWRQSKNVSLAISETQPEPAAQVSES